MTPDQKTALLKNSVAKAVSHVGDQEVPRGSNWGPQVRTFLEYAGYSGPASWCMAFAVFCVGKTAESMGLALRDTNLVRTGYCPAQADVARSRGVLVSADEVRAGHTSLRPGWLMLEWIPSEGGYHHTGIIETVGPNQGVFGTIEGNTNTTGGNEGYEAARQRRHIADRAGDGHAKYAFVMTV